MAVIVWNCFIKPSDDGCCFLLPFGTCYKGSILIEISSQGLVLFEII